METKEKVDELETTEELNPGLGVTLLRVAWLAIGWIWTRPLGGVKAHVGVGLAIGIVFGGAMMALLYGGEPAPATDIVSRGINEVLFTVGCAMVLFAARALGSRAS